MSQGQVQTQKSPNATCVLNFSWGGGGGGDQKQVTEIGILQSSFFTVGGWGGGGKKYM